MNVGTIVEADMLKVRLVRSRAGGAGHTGPIARGGLRWSDRRDDFRTEVLGLMKAQRVKNAVIVPTGAKGGFYPKQLPNPQADREAWLAEGKDSYKLFIRTLLSITDNIAGGKVVHPVLGLPGGVSKALKAEDLPKFATVTEATTLPRGVIGTTSP